MYHHTRDIGTVWGVRFSEGTWEIPAALRCVALRCVLGLVAWYGALSAEPHTPIWPRLVSHGKGRGDDEMDEMGGTKC